MGCYIKQLSQFEDPLFCVLHLACFEGTELVHFHYVMQDKKIIEDEGIMFCYKLTTHDVNQRETADSLDCIQRKSVNIMMCNVFFLLF